MASPYCDLALNQADAGLSCGVRCGRGSPSGRVPTDAQSCAHSFRMRVLGFLRRCGGFQQAEGENVSNLPPRLQRFTAHLSVRRCFGTLLLEVGRSSSSSHPGTCHADQGDCKPQGHHAHTDMLPTWAGTDVAAAAYRLERGPLEALMLMPQCLG